MRIPLPGDSRLRAVRPALSIAVAAALCLSCGRIIEQADLEEFVDTGLTNVLLRSASFSPGVDDLELIPSDTTVTCRVSIINPKSFDVSYTLSWTLDDGAFASLPPAEPAASSPTDLSFSFSLNPAFAEHKKLIFSLGKYVHSINKSFDRESFSVTCDSPPHEADQVAAAVDYQSQLSAVAIRLPSSVTDRDDLAKLRITWRREDSSSSSSGTFTISSLESPPDHNPFSGSYDCYLRPSGTQAGYGYTYSVVVIDKAGQESASTSEASRPDYFRLYYAGNGGTGGAPASAEGRYNVIEDSAIVAANTFTYANYAFSSWNTKANGTGTSYDPGDSFLFPASETTLYAQWYTAGISLSFDLAPQGLAFQPNSVSVRAGDSVNAQCSNTTLSAITTGWAWYIDGVLAGALGNDSELSFTPTISDIGSHIVSCTVEYNGIVYSGYFLLVVTE
jgi:plastocyanin